MAFPFSDRLQSLLADQREDTSADTSADWIFFHRDHPFAFCANSGVLLFVLRRAEEEIRPLSLKQNE